MRVLVVEDEHRIAASIKKGLEQEGFAADLAYDGEEGLFMALNEEYDLLVLDRMLPGIDGVEVCKQLREKQLHTPIIMLTAKGQVEDKVEGLDSGADDYLTKPFAFEELVARIRALVRRPAVATGTKLIADSLTLDPATFEVSVDNKSISLSSKEFSILEYLMRNAGMVISKEKIISHVWNYDSDILPNTVEVNIRNLRKKIEKPFGKELIQTVRGFGYRIQKNYV